MLQTIYQMSADGYQRPCTESRIVLYFSLFTLHFSRFTYKKMRHRIRKRPMSEINVVPYIDVMLVLLVIFMITAPLLSQGVKVDLPKGSLKIITDRTE